MDYRLGLMCGSDLPLPCLQTTLHQPRIKEIALLGEADFFTGVQCLCLNKTMFVQDKSVLLNTNNFQIFMTVMSNKDAKDKKQATSAVLSLLFPTKQVMFTPQSILLNEKDAAPIFIDESNFEEIQALLHLVFCVNDSHMDQHSFNPVNAKAKAIADKIMKGRERVAAIKGESNTSIFSQYLSTLTIGCSSMSLEDLMNLTMFQLYDLMERYMLYVNWDLDIRSRLAGGSPDNQPENWMKNIH